MIAGTDILEAHNGAVLLHDDHVIEVFFGYQATLCAQCNFGVLAFNTAAGKVHVLALQGCLHIGRCKTVRRKLHRIHTQAHGALTARIGIYQANTGYGLKAFFNIDVHKVGNVFQAACIALNGEEHEELGRAGLFDDGGFDIGWQLLA